MYKNDWVNIFQALDPYFGLPWTPAAILKQPVT